MPKINKLIKLLIILLYKKNLNFGLIKEIKYIVHILHKDNNNNNSSNKPINLLYSVYIREL